MSRSFRKGRHPGNIARAQQSWSCDHLSPIRNTGKVNRHLLQRLKKRRRCAQSLRKREMHIYDNERQAHCEFMHRHRLWNRRQREERFLREARRCEEQTARKRDVAERIADWLEEQETRDADLWSDYESCDLDWYEYLEFELRREERNHNHDLDNEYEESHYAAADYTDSVYDYYLDHDIES